MEFNSAAITAAGSGVDAVALERAYYPNRSKLHTEVEQGRLVGQGLQVLQRSGWLVRGGQHTL